MAGQPTRSRAGLATLLLLSFLIPAQAAIVGWGGRDVTFTPPTLNGPINTIIQLKVGANAGKYLIGGSFTDAGGNAAIDYVARLNANGTIDTSFVPPVLGNGTTTCALPDGTNGPQIDVRALLEVQTTSGTNVAGRIMIGGNFTTNYGGNARNYLVRVAANGGTTATGFVPSNTGTTAGTQSYTSCVKSMFTAEGSGNTLALVVTLQGNSRVSKKVFDTGADYAGFTAPTFAASVVNTGFFCPAATCGADRYVLGGGFPNVNGDTKMARLVRLNTNGTVDTSAYPTTDGTSAGTILFNGRVNSIALTSLGTILVGGIFTDVGGNTDADKWTELWADDLTQTFLTSLPLNGDVYSVAEDVNNGYYLFAGAFTDAGGYPACDYICQSSTGGDVVDGDGRSIFVAPPPTAPVNVVTVNSYADGNVDKYMIGGSFTNLGSNTNTDYVGRLNQADPASVTLNSSGGNNPGGADGIRTVYSNGQWQVYREGSGQLFEPTNDPPIDLMYNQIALSLTAPGGGGYMIGPSSLYFGGQNIDFAGGYLYRPWGTVTATGGSTGSGTAASDLTVEVDGRTYVVHLNLSYTYPDNYVRQTFTVDIPAGNTYNVKLYNLYDSYLGGSDNGPGFSTLPRSSWACPVRQFTKLYGT